MGRHCYYSPWTKKKPSYATGRRLVVIFKPRTPYAPWRSSSIRGVGGWVSPTAGLYGLGEENNFWPLLSFEPPIDPARSKVAFSTTLPRLPTMMMIMIIITFIFQFKWRAEFDDAAISFASKTATFTGNRGSQSGSVRKWMRSHMVVLVFYSHFLFILQPYLILVPFFFTSSRPFSWTTQFTINGIRWIQLLCSRIIQQPYEFNSLNPELNPICYLLALLGAHHFLHVSRIRVKLLAFRLLMSYIYGAPILDVSRSHTTTQHSR